jgi:hypothetical protein
MFVGSNLRFWGSMVVSDGGKCMVEGSYLGLFGGQFWSNNHPQNQQSQTPRKPSRPPGLFFSPRWPPGGHI